MTIDVAEVYNAKVVSCHNLSITTMKLQHTKSQTLHVVYEFKTICTYWLSGRAGWENIWLEVMAYGLSAARSVRHDRDPNIFLSSPT